MYDVAIAWVIINMTANLVFDDEFDVLSTRALGATTGTWDTQLWWGPDTTVNNEDQYYVDTSNDRTSKSGGYDPFSVVNGVLSITAAQAQSGTSDNKTFDSGVLTTEHSFTRTYGYFETRAQMPEGAGTAPAFWLLAASHQWPPELDVVEEIGQQPTDIVGTVHTKQITQLGSDRQFFQATPDVTAGFHTYGVDWQVDKITWYFDGQAYGSTTTPNDMHSPMFMVANLAIGGTWPGSPQNPSQLDASYKIDYMRVWDKFPGVAMAGGSGPTSPAPQQASDTIELKLSEDAWQGDAQAAITIDGKQIGDIQTITALQNQGQTQTIALTGSWGTGAHDIGIQFINDAYGGTPTTDRNLYVNTVTFDGQIAPSPPAILYANGTVHVLTAASPLLLQLSEDAYAGDAQFSVAIDGNSLGKVQSVTALHTQGALQDFAFGQPVTAGTHDIAVSFLNDCYGGTPATDRNLYVNAIVVNGATIPGTAASLFSAGTQHFSITVAAQP